MTRASRNWSFLPLVAAVAVLAGALAAAQVGSPSPAQAAARSGTARCSVATLKGTYVFTGQGDVQIGGITRPLAVAGVQVFDGRGHGHGFYSQSIGGKISKRVSFTATYTLKPDCTGTHTATDAAGTVRHTDQYSLPSGSRVTFLGTDPGVVFSGTGVAEAKEVDS